MTRKAVRPRSAEQALEWIEQLTAFPCCPISHQIVRIAIEQSARHRISYWDAAILSAAQAMGCKTVYSEDLNDGQQYSDVRVIIPLSVRQFVARLRNRTAPFRISDVADDKPDSLSTIHYAANFRLRGFNSNERIAAAQSEP